jgi:hypothetical protein
VARGKNVSASHRFINCPGFEMRPHPKIKVFATASAIAFESADIDNVLDVWPGGAGDAPAKRVIVRLNDVTAHACFF